MKSALDASHLPERIQQFIATNKKKPYILLDKQTVTSIYALLNAYIDTDVYFAVKSAPHLALLKHLLSIGASLDVSSIGEIDLAVEAGAREQNLLFTHPYKTQATFMHALSRQCRMFVVDSFSEVKKMQQWAPQAPIKRILRIAFPNDHALINLSEKFGCALSDAEKIIRQSEQLGAPISGISFHVGSQMASALPFVQAIESIQSLIEQTKTSDTPIDLIDIGGGFPADYDQSIDYDAFFTPIKDALAQLPSYVQRISEPGRFLIAPAGWSISQVVGRRWSNGKMVYHLNDGLYGSYSGQIFDHMNFQLGYISRYKNKRRFPSVIFGPTCDSTDMITGNISLPLLSENDIIFGLFMGAYTFASSTTFNSIPLPNIYFLD